MELTWDSKGTCINPGLIFMTKKLIDTTVLVYAYDNSDSRKHEVAKGLLKNLQANGEGVLSIQNLVEFSRVLSEKSKPPVPHSKVRSYVLQLKALFEIIHYDETVVAEALHISPSYSIHFFDALLAATMEMNFITEIITENESDFKKIPNIKVINPF